jgi:CheY-like chemotaxis protein
VKRPGQGKVRGNVEAAVDWALSSTARELLLRARITRDMAPVPNVTLSETRLGQVLVNLLLNAAHAIDPGRVGENEVRLRVYSPEPGRVVLQVSDTGHGVPAAMLPRLFEPFFTTKPVGRGTGLGLSVCKSIVEAAGGGIEVESKEGVGTTFSLSLPVARETTIPAPAAKVEAVARRLALLVVDDEPLITRSLVRLLSPRHDVQAVHDVDAALRVLSSGAAIDAILCDLVMPDRTGIELYAELRTRGSELSERIVFLTGGGLTPALSSFLRGFPSRILHKPCEPSEIEVMLERVCARPEG